VIPKPLATAVVVLVSAVWAGNFAASVFVPGYSSDASINFVFASIVGGAMALRGGEKGGPGLLSRLTSALHAPPPPAAPPEPPAPAREEQS